MVSSAYVLVSTKSGSERAVVEALRKMQEVTDAKILYGEFDVIAKVQVDDIQELNKFLIEKVRPINSVERTSTLIVAA
jgi:DNA-binding Lrp family transcriptional regulator